MTATPAANTGLPEDLERALAHLQNGERQEAARLANAHLQQQPADGAGAAWYLLGTVALQDAQFSAAQEHFRRAFENTLQNSARAMCWNGLGHAAAGLAESGRAQEAFRRATLADPASPQYAMDYAQALFAAGQRPLGMEILNQVMRRGCRTPALCVRLGNLLVQYERFQEALQQFNRALSLDQDYAPAYFNASVALAILGKPSPALAACKRALDLDPSLAGYYQLTSLGGLDGDAQRITTLEKRVADGGEENLNARIDAGFALARVYEHGQDYPQAFRHLAKANQLKRGSFDFSIATETQRIDRIIAFFSADFIARHSGKVQSALRPIFILGMPRSGSTLLEQMLAGHPAVSACGELDCMTDVARRLGAVWEARAPASPGTDEQVVSDLRQAAAEYEHAVHSQHQTGEYFTDKMPSNFLFVGLIHLTMPGARILHIRRDPMDTCLSCYQHLFTGYMPYTYDLKELGEYYLLYRKIMQHWHAVLPANRMLDVDYEALVGAPETEIKKVLDYCGLAFDARCLDHQSVQRPVNTASANQVRKPIYSSAIGRWRHYEPYLTSLTEALAAVE